MKKIEITSSVVGGRLYRNRKRLAEAIASFEGKTINIIVKVSRKRRSDAQNGYYWAVIVVIWQKIFYEEWGEHYSKAETHEFLKFNCNYYEKVNERTGEIIRISKSTCDNSTVDQEMFHDNARKLAFEMFSVEIPLPNEQINLEI